MKNRTHIDRDFGWFVGEFDQNQKHRHYAIQLSIPFDNKIIVKTSEITIESENPVLIKSNVTHQIISDSKHFLLLINPASTIGHFWNQLTNAEIQEVSIAPAEDLIRVITAKGEHEKFSEQINDIIKRHDCFCSSAVHNGDERINKALAYLSENFERVISLDEIASHCHISPSRFLHLFKEETGITYRRVQLWNKIVKGLPLFGSLSFTEIAHQNGFSDSAHLSRVFKENFGFGPREFLKISQFVQV